MPAVQIRDLEQETYEMLKASAQRNRRSIAQQVEYFIDEGLRNEARRMQAELEPEAYDPVWGVRLRSESLPVFAERREPGREESPSERKERHRRLYEEFRAMPRIDMAGWPDPTDVIRQMRDERTEHLFSLGEGVLK